MQSEKEMIESMISSKDAEIEALQKKVEQKNAELVELYREVNNHKAVVKRCKEVIRGLVDIL